MAIPANIGGAAETPLPRRDGVPSLTGRRTKHTTRVGVRRKYEVAGRFEVLRRMRGGVRFAIPVHAARLDTIGGLHPSLPRLGGPRLAVARPRDVPPRGLRPRGVRLQGLRPSVPRIPVQRIRVPRLPRPPLPGPPVRRCPVPAGPVPRPPVP